MGSAGQQRLTLPEMVADQKHLVAERVIAAPAQAIFDVLADPAQHVVIDGSGTVTATRGEPSRLSLGARFGMSMRQGVSYRTRPKVVEFDEPRQIAWRNPAGPTWRYELAEQGGATRVVETYDLTSARGVLVIRLLGYPRRTQKSMERTLERLEQLVSAKDDDTTA